MIRMMLSQAAQALGGSLDGADAAFTGVSTDSRQWLSGALFIALGGESFDGHDFLAQARARGAVGALVSRRVDDPLPQVRVAEPLAGLQTLAALWRQRFRGQVVGLTGSNGKTTVKAMTAAILRQAGSTLATQGNFNNHIGVPLTLLELADETFAVVEMGANHPGEIALLAGLARPDLAIITQAGRAHLAGFGSLEGVATAKGEIIDAVPEEGTVVLNADDPFLPLWQARAGSRRVVTFGLDESATIRAVAMDLRWDDAGFASHFQIPWQGHVLDIRLALAGIHNVRNALAAAAAAISLGVAPTAVATGLAGLSPGPGRLHVQRRADGAWVVDDSYNANPDSLAAAIAVLAAAPGTPWLVLGDLGELGPDGLALHRSLGERARAAGLARLYATGSLAAGSVATFGPGGRHFATPEALIETLRVEVNGDVAVLIKGSRSARMERVVQALMVI